MQLKADMPIYMAYEKVKDCLCLKFSIEDTRILMFKNNFLEDSLKRIVVFFAF